MRQTRFVATLALICAAIWVFAAIHPLDRQAWILENVLLVLFVALLGLTYRRLRLSNGAYLCTALKDMACAFIGAVLVAAWLTLRRL